MKKLLSLFRRKPKVTYIICPQCQAQNQIAGDLITQQAVHQSGALNQYRHDLAGGNKLKQHLFANIYNNYVQNVGSASRRRRG